MAPGPGDMPEKDDATDPEILIARLGVQESENVQLRARQGKVEEKLDELIGKVDGVLKDNGQILALAKAHLDQEAEWARWRKHIADAICTGGLAIAAALKDVALASLKWPGVIVPGGASLASLVFSTALLLIAIPAGSTLSLTMQELRLERAAQARNAHLAATSGAPTPDPGYQEPTP